MRERDGRERERERERGKEGEIKRATAVCANLLSDSVLSSKFFFIPVPVQYHVTAPRPLVRARVFDESVMSMTDCALAVLTLVSL